MIRVAIVTCCELPEIDQDEKLTLDALRGVGFEAELAAWDDESVDWKQYDGAVLRSPWNYPDFPVEFEAFLRRVSTETRLWNPLEVVQKNLHKSYLLELQEKGIPVVPTELVRGRGDIVEICNRKSWQKIVVKPAIGAGSMGTQFFEREAWGEAQVHLEELLREGDVLVQPYLDSVDVGGERSLIWIDGEFTHKIVKSPRFIGQEESVSSSIEILPEELEMGELVMKSVEGDLLYGRVDLMVDGSGELLLSELELVEPSLFFNQNPESAIRFATALRDRLN